MGTLVFYILREKKLSQLLRKVNEHLQAKAEGDTKKETSERSHQDACDSEVTSSGVETRESVQTAGVAQVLHQEKLQERTAQRKKALTICLLLAKRLGKS